MAALSSEVKAFIVQALACFDTPSQVAEAVKREFNIEVSRQQVESHDPTKRCSKTLAKRWVDMFHDARERFRHQTIDIPIANRAYRLRAMGRIIEKAESMKNLSLALQVLEQAAKETGDAYVNRRVEPDKSLDDEIKRLNIQKLQRELEDPDKGLPEPKRVIIGVEDATDPDAE
ncbi:DUF2280 domain-containing protein [Pseudomonas syringae pv. tagetis]|uniref:DUF2280 domain-containing protein n=4 Tax=root TaxID=1 RepID=A0AB37ZQI0_PSESX|nr:MULTISPECIES: DUF2280 domain-containing protein [Pseudomonas syringae group]YP_010773191.1 hypothetical protein QIT81_gp79 [Pseudomonas phage MR15]QJD55140.1 hypothetical protein Psm1vBMR13_gp78 [Pseudomonas phage MR13]KPX57085.1 putative phage protein [Pseudomonas amygdali pv. hibisci]KPY83721.1 Uncharacterized protein ALO44_00141 [Pseudomonas syringae pv. tagetis]PBP34583.1 hypothetical protein CCL11_25705 [Pseudomonas syringae]QJD55293.1 hypothetical protein Psm1vBMR15_gp79 [Pseudomonas